MTFDYEFHRDFVQGILKLMREDDQPQLPRPLITQTELDRLHDIEATAIFMVDNYWDEFSGLFTPPSRTVKRLYDLCHRIPPPHTSGDPL